MNFFKSLIIFLYLLIYIIVGGTLIIFALNIFSLEQIISGIDYVYSSQNLTLAIGIIGLMFMLIGIISAQMSFGKMKREKTICFDNPDGQVVISLNAIEDFIKKVIKDVPQVKEIRSLVSANKKGISVVSKATLFSDSNIPELTEKIQSMVKSKLMEMLGIEESISVKIHVIKLIARSEKEEAREPKEASRHIPFGTA